MRSLLRLLPFVTVGCSLVAGFEEFSAGAGGQAGSAGDGGGAHRGGNVSASGGAAGASGTAGNSAESGGSGAGNGTSGRAASGSSGAGGGLVGSAGAEGGADPGGGSDAGGSPGGSGAGGSAQGGSSATAGNGGVSGEASCGELLVNGDFDLGPSGDWREYVTYSDDLRLVVPKDDPWLAAEGVEPVGGDYLAWLGGIPDNELRSHKSRLHQTVRIPAKASRLRFRGWLWVKTLEPEADAPYDRSYAQIVRVEGAPDESSVFHVFSQWSNLDSSTGWAEFDVDTTELDALRDRTLTLEVYSETDLDYETSFWLDSLSLYADCAR